MKVQWRRRRVLVRYTFFNDERYVRGEYTPTFQKQDECNNTKLQNLSTEQYWLSENSFPCSPNVVNVHVHCTMARNTCSRKI